jgi:ribonuclease R
LSARALDYMTGEGQIPQYAEQMLTGMGLPPEEMPQLQQALNQLEGAGELTLTKKKKYAIPQMMGMISGRLQMNARGFGFVLREDAPDIFIPAEAMNGAMHEDMVLAHIHSTDSKRGPEGEIVRVLSRRRARIVGTFGHDRYFGFVTPDDKRIPQDIVVHDSETMDAKPGEKVVAEIISWPDRRRGPEGRVVEVIGDPEEPGVDVLCIARQYELPEEFPDHVLAETKDVPAAVTQKGLQGREDLTEILTVTIDGEDAKDLDDAISLEVLDTGWRLGVHIADVSHYVAVHSALDIEALARGTSVYLVDRVIPMLPPALSNGICSLNPNVKRLAMSVFMDMDAEGNVTDHRFARSVILSDARMTYTAVNAILEDDNKKLIEQYARFVPMFREMEKLAAVLRKKRQKRGALDFDLPEAKITLDEMGRPVKVGPYPRGVGNKMIEEFMLSANETVAEHLYWAGAPCMYRVHERPDPEKMDAFIKLLGLLGHHVKGHHEAHPKELANLLKTVQDRPEEGVISRVMLRSMQKARYSPQSLGHFGLAADYYCHFTSPIRRYPDLTVHRILKDFVTRKLDEKRMAFYVKHLDDDARHCSEREQVAQEAEREADQLKKVEYMAGKVGEVYEGVVSGVTGFGLFVELPNTVEGMIRLSDLDDDYYVYDADGYCLIGQRTRRMIRLGDEMRIRVTGADIEGRTVSFVPEPEEERRHER